MTKDSRLPGHDPIRSGWIILALSSALALLMALVDGESFGLIRKWTAPQWIASRSDYDRHEAFLVDTDATKQFIVFTGTCELESSMQPPESLMTVRRAPIARQLEREFKHRGLTHVSVLNLAAGGIATTRNLHIFLRFLEDPRYHTFVWQNDYLSADLWMNDIIYDGFIYNKLGELKNRFTNVPEIDRLLDAMTRLREPGTGDEQGLVPSPISIHTRAADIWKSALDSVQEMAASLLTADQFQKMGQNTFYLREVEYRVDEYRFKDVPYIPGESERIEVPDSLRKEMEHPDTAEIRAQSGAQLAGANLLILRIIGKLAEAYNKRVFVLFGPGGRSTMQENHVYDRKFKGPILEAIRDLPALKVMDLSELPMDTQDIWGVRPTYSGSHKIAQRMFDLIYDDEKNAFH